MKLVASAEGALSLEGADDLRSLSLVAEGDDAALARALAGAGRIDADRAHAWVAPAALDRLAGRQDDAGWREGFAAMLAFAHSRGWVDQATGEVRVHIVRSA